MHPGALELLLDDELLHRTRRPSVRLGPVRHDVAGLDEPGALLILRQATDALGEGAHLVADRFGLGRQLHLLATRHAAPGEIGEIGSRIGRAEERQEGGCPPHVEVGVVFPRDGDATVHLGVEVGAEVGGGCRQRGGDGSGERELVTTGRRGLRCVPHGRRRELGRHDHVGAVVLDCLVGADHPAELDALLGVGGRHVGALAGEADRLGRQHEAGEVDERLASTGDHGGGRPVERDLGGAAGRVEVGRHVDGDPVAHLDDGDVVAGGHEEHAGERAAEDDSGGTAGRPALDGDVSVERSGGSERAVRESRQPRRLRRIIRDCGDQRTDDDGGHERPGSIGTPQLLDDDRQLLEAVPRAAVLLGEVQAEPTELGQLAPELGQGLLGAVEQGTRRCAGVALGQEVGGRFGEGAMVIGDGERHGGTSFVSRWDGDGVLVTV